MVTILPGVYGKNVLPLVVVVFRRDHEHVQTQNLRMVDRTVLL